MLLPRPRVVISALKGGAGKTTVALSLAAAWGSKDLQVAAFKKGPDYIDAGWLSRACNDKCRNLDPHLMGWPGIMATFLSASNKNSLALIEGNRGLFDGLDRHGSTSTAELAKRLQAPVVLVVDCTKSTRSVAAMVLGCLRYDPEVNIAGVILNQVAGKRHENLIRDCLEDINVEVFGVIPRFKRDLPERHMGLVPPQEHPEVRTTLAWLAELGSKNLDLDRLLKLSMSAPELTDISEGYEQKIQMCRIPSVKIGIIEDTAFQFYYPENIETLQREGAEIIKISAISDETLPELDGLYIGGGFPETQAAQLADNLPFKNALKEAAGKGMPIYAECGGLMYLSESLLLNGRTFPMTGVLPIHIDVQKKPQGHGYTEVVVDRDNPFYPEGTVLKGHEFHYSRVIDLGGMEESLTFKMTRGQGILNHRDGITFKNILATYTHIHAHGTPLWAKGLIKRAREFGTPARTELL